MKLISSAYLAWFWAGWPSARTFGLRFARSWVRSIVVAAMLVPASAFAIDPPHATTDLCASCHMPHQAPGGSLSAAAGNPNLCMSCHQSGGAASSSPFANSDQALPWSGLPALTNATGFTIGTISNFAFALFDNDQPTIQFDSSGTADVPENGGPVSVNVQISQAADATVQVASVGNAAPGSDFTLSATQFIFTAAGPISQALTVTLIDDTIPEPTESVSLNLVAPAGAGLGLATNFTFNLLDNEPSVQFTKSSATVSEGDGTYQLVVFKSSTNNTVTGNIAVGGTAQPGADFTLSATNFTLAGATTSATITVTLVDDSVAEADETATFTLSEAL